MVSYMLDMHIISLWGLNLSFDLLTLKGHSQGQRSRSLGLVTNQIEATVAWNMMVTKTFIFGLTLTNGVKLLKCPKNSFVQSLIHWACT